MSPAGPILNCPHCQLGLFHTHCPGCLAAMDEPGLCSQCQVREDPRGPWLGALVLLLAMFSWVLVASLLYPWEAIPTVHPDLLEALRKYP